MPLFKTPPPSTSAALLEEEDEGGGCEDASVPVPGLRRSQRPRQQRILFSPPTSSQRRQKWPKASNYFTPSQTSQSDPHTHPAPVPGHPSSPPIPHSSKNRPAVPLPQAQAVLPSQPHAVVPPLTPPPPPATPPAPQQAAEDLDINAELEFWEAEVQAPPPTSPRSTASQQQAAHGQQIPPVPLPTFQEALETYVPTHKYPPKAVRADFSRTIADLWQQLADNPGDEKLWLLSFIFARVIIPAGPNPERDHQSKVQAIRDRLRRWRQGEVGCLWKEAVKISKSRPKGKRKQRQPAEEKTLKEKNVARATKLGEEGQYTRSLQALVSHGLAEQSREVLQEMKAKHPQSPPPNIPASEISAQVFTPQQVSDAAKSFHKGSAAGPSGFRPEHMMVVLKGSPPNRSSRAETQLTRVVNAMAKGKLPASVTPYMCGARLHAGIKKDGSFRPIAVGNLLRRLTSKAMVRALQGKLQGLLSPHQLGVAVTGGCEIAVHTVKEAVSKRPDKWVLQLDLENAFNSVDRSTMLAQVAKLLPESLAWAVSCYGSPSFLQFGSSTLSSSTGVQQGDPYASAAFALTLQPVIEEIQEQLPLLDVHAWFHDDGNAVGTLVELRTLVDIVRQIGPAMGFHLNPDKSSVWCPQVLGPGDPDPLQRGIKRVEDSGIKLLGSPVGSSDFTRRFLLAKVEKVRSLTAELHSLQHPQLEFVLLRGCLALPKIMFLLRTTNTTTFTSTLQDFDTITREGLGRILGGPTSTLGWEQAKLPVGMGGLGLRSAVDHSEAAYACSLTSSKPLIRELLRLTDDDLLSLPQDLLSRVSKKMGEENEASDELIVGLGQKRVSSKIDLENKRLLSERVRGEGCEREIARLNSVSIEGSHSGDWLTVPPSPGLGLRLQPAEFVVALRQRLGHPIFSSAGPCPACGQASDALGDHAMNCAWHGERIARHNALRDTIHSTAANAALAPTKEGRFLLPGEGGRPADIFIPHWSAGRDAALDVTVINPLQAAQVHGAAATAGHALGEAHRRKLDKSWEACHRQGIEFLPLAVECLGAWHPSAIAELKKLGSALARQTGEEESTSIQRLFQRLSISLVKGNAALFNNRSPSEPIPMGDELTW